MSDVQEIVLLNDGTSIKVYYKFGGGSNSDILECRSQEERDWLLERINQFLKDVRTDLYNSSLPHYYWVDFSSERKEILEQRRLEEEAIAAELAAAQEELQSEKEETTEEEKQFEAIDVLDIEDTAPPLEEPDNRPGWKKLLQID